MWNVVLGVGLLLLSVAFRPKPQSAKPALGSVTVNTLEEGAPIRVIFGKPWIKGANAGWWGDKRAVAIKSSGGKK